MNINQVWPEWNEDCVLGEGSFGKVYRAKRVEYGRTFYSAIKVLTVPKNQQEVKVARSQGMNDNEIYEYFRGVVDNLLNEITLMDNLKGAQNVVGIEDYKIIEREGEIGWDIFIRMELLTPFDSFVSNPEFSQKDVIKLGVDICTALEVCERNYIVHRDIKPDNIFISRFGEYKLGDFGIARKLEATQANLSRKGTLNYMAPEVYKSEEYGSNVDIYSLGLVLYTLLNNNRIAFLPPYPQPITYKDNEEALSRRLSGAPMIPPCNASSSLGSVIVKACAYSPKDRYQSATEFKNALVNEWNYIVQSGDNRGINADVIRFENNIDQKLQSTTNDMTANGRLVVDELSQGTTVLNGSSNYSQQSGYEQSYDNSAYYGNNSISLPNEYQISKSSKICRILSLPIGVVVCVLACVLLFSRGMILENQVISFPLLGIGLSMLLSSNNKIAIGLSTIALSIPYIFVGLVSIISQIYGVFPVNEVVVLVSGALLFFSGIVMTTQKEVRFGGSLAIYAVALEWIFNIYQLINGDFNTNMLRIFIGITEIFLFVWSYGYKRDTQIAGIKKVLHIIAYTISAIVLIYVVYILFSSGDLFVNLHINMYR